MAIFICLSVCLCCPCSSIRLLFVTALASLVALFTLTDQQILKIWHSLQKYFRIIAWQPGVCNRLSSSLDMTLENQIVGRCHVIVFVCLDALASIVNINVMLL